MRIDGSKQYQVALLPGVLTSTDVDQYWTEGYTVARGIFDLQDVERLRTACDELCDMAAHFQQDTYMGVTYFNLLRACDPFDPQLQSIPQIPGMLRRVTYPYYVSQTIDAYRQHPRLLGTISQLLGANVVQLVNQVNFNPPGIGTGWGWHQDYRFRRHGLKDFIKDFVQCVMAIDHSSTANGGIRLVPKSFQLGPLKLDQDPQAAKDLFLDQDVVTPTLEPGDAVLFNAYMIHGSTANRSTAQRRVFINGYAREAACPHGIPVISNQKLVTERSGIMEFEQELDKLPLTSKY